MDRKLSFEKAARTFIHRFTMEHVPAWSRLEFIGVDGETWYAAPQYRTDREWYNNTKFHGEHELAQNGTCYTSNETWPLGRSLTKPYRKET